MLVSRVKRPFSHLLPLSGFPEDVEIWTLSGEVARKVADVPSREGVPLNGVQTGPRGIGWRQDQPATVKWTEGVDGGDMENNEPLRDKGSSVAAPFTCGPHPVAMTLS